MIRRTTWILLAIFLILLIVLFSLQRFGDLEQAGVTPTQATSFLFDVQEKTITGLRITDNIGNIVEVQKVAGSIWTVLEPMGVQADSERIESAIDQVGRIRVLTILKSALDFANIGLNPAAYQVKITLDDNQQQTAFIGDLTTTGSGYYAFLAGKPEMVVDKISIDSLIGFITDPPIVKTPTSLPNLEMTPTIQP